MIETVDISLVDDVPTVRQVLKEMVAHYDFGQAYMAEEFTGANGQDLANEYRCILGDIPLEYEPHEEVFKKRVPSAIGLIRTGDTTPFGNIILKSA